MIVRQATGADVVPVGSLERLLFGKDAWTESSVGVELTAADRVAAVATQDEEVIGYLTAARTGDALDVRRIGVHPRHRRRGVARALLAAVTTGPKADGSDHLLLEVSATNTTAVAFYAAEGFTEISRRPRYYRDGSDALVMARQR